MNCISSKNFHSSHIHSFNPLSSFLSTPNFIRSTFTFRLRHPPRDKSAQHERQSRKQVIDPPPLAHGFVQNGKELRDDKGGDPIRRQGPTLRRAHGFRAHELVGQDERDGAEADGEGGDEEEGGDRGEELDALTDADGEEDGTAAHAGYAEEDAGFAADLVGQGGADGGEDEVEGADGDG